MPTKKPRVSVVLEPEMAEELRRMGQLLGMSDSAILADLAKFCRPFFSRLLLVLEAQKRAEERGMLEELRLNRDLILLGRRTSRRMKHRTSNQWADFVRLSEEFMKMLEVPSPTSGRAGTSRSAVRLVPARPDGGGSIRRSSGGLRRGNRGAAAFT